MAKDEKNLANSIGLEEVNTEEAIEEVAYDMLYALYKDHPKKHADEMAEIEAEMPEGMTAAEKKAYLKDMEGYTEERMNQRIEEVFKDWTGGAKWRKAIKVKSMLLLGPPGQGKTTTFKESAKKVAGALGLQFKLNPPDDVPISRKDYMFVSMEFSGENQVTVVGGIPAKVTDDATGIEYMTKLVNKRLAMARVAGGATVLLDDFPNATPSVQNVGLSLTDEKRFQGLNLENVYIGLTGNLGSLDGTHTAPLSAALRGRCKIYYTEDKLPNWISRMQQKYRDSLGDVGVVGFLTRDSHYFAEMPNTRLKGGFASPRTWDHFVQEARRAIVECGGPGKGEHKAMGKIQRLASAFLGLEVGLKLHSYYHSMMLGADPIARKLIQTGEFDKEEFAKRYKDGYSADSQFFAYQFAVAVADYAVNDLVQSKDYSFDANTNKRFKEILERYATGILAVSDDTFAFAIDHFKAKLANQIDEWSTKMEKNRVLTTPVKMSIANVISMARPEEFTAEKRQVMIDALSDSDKFQKNITRRRASSTGSK